MKTRVCMFYFLCVKCKGTITMAQYFKLMIIMVTLAYVSCLPMVQDQEDKSGSVVEEAASEGDEIDLSSDGYKGTDADSDEVFLDSDDEENHGAVVLSRLYARKNEITKLVMLLKIIDDGLKLKGGVDQISSGIDLKKEGYKEIFNKETLKSGLEKSIEGDQLVLKGMRQSGKALFSLGLDSAFAIAVNKLGNSK